MHAPLLWMGLLGFGEAQHLHNLLRTRTRVRWAVAPSQEEADALWVNGAVARLDGELVRVSAPGAEPLSLRLADISRPVAFTSPLADESLRAAGVTTFDPREAASIAGLLAAFEQRLRPLTAQLAVAAQVARRRNQMSAAVYHLLRAGSLAGVVVPGGPIGLAPDLAPAQVAELAWHPRPESAGTIPPHFEQVTSRQLMWRYATRTDDDLLPAACRLRPLRLVESPRVARGSLRDGHLRVLAALKDGPATLDELAQRGGLAGAELTRCVAALYHVGSLEPLADDEVHRAPRRPVSPLREQFAGLAIPPRPGTAGGSADTVLTPLEP